MGLITPCENRRPLTFACVATYFKSAFEVRMDKPEFLPERFYNIYRLMLSEGIITPIRQRFFSDQNLKKFWTKAEVYINSIDAQFRSDAASILVGIFITTPLHYVDAGTKDRPTFKTMIRNNQIQADKLIVMASKQADELANTLRKIHELTSYYPDELEFLDLVTKTIYNENSIDKISSYWQITPTHDALLILKTGLENYPKANEVFKNNPLLSSQKSSWNDWLKSVLYQLTRMSVTYSK